MMFEQIGMQGLVLALSIGGSLAGLAGVGLLMRHARAETPAASLDQIVQAAPYQRLGNALKVAEG